MAAIETVKVEVEVHVGTAQKLCYAILTRSPAMSFITDDEGVSFPHVTLPRPEWDALLMLARKALSNVQA